MNEVRRAVELYENGVISKMSLLIELVSMAAISDPETVVSDLPTEVREWLKAEVIDFNPGKQRRIWLGESWVGSDAAAIVESRKRAAEEAYHRGSENLHRYFFG